MDPIQKVDKRWVIPVLNIQVEETKLATEAGVPFSVSQVKMASYNVSAEDITAGKTEGNQMSIQQAIYYMIF